MTDERQLKPGDVVAGRYRLEGLLGEGGMGFVYEAVQLKLERPVALKVLLPHLDDHKDARVRFEREARVAATLRHRNAVDIYDFGEDHGRLFIAMELLRGETLREHVDAGLAPMPVERALDIFGDICDVLSAAHGIGLVHRDLKPENIFLEKLPSGDERVVVVDFGLAFIQDSADVGRLTREGVATGTPAYIAPEQALGKEVGPPADVYSLACVLFETLTSQLPFVAESAVELATKHVFMTPPGLSSVCPDRGLPQILDDLVERMLSKHPPERPTAAEVHEALRAGRMALGSRERGRDDSHLLDRQSRAVVPVDNIGNLATVEAHWALDADAPATTIAVLGHVAEPLALALASNNLQRVAVEGAEIPSEAHAVFALGATVNELEAMCLAGIPIIADADPSDMSRMTKLLSLCVDEVVPVGSTPDEAVRRIWRAIRKNRRSR